MTPAERERLTELRRALLHLHKILLDAERAAYEREHGRTGGGELLQIIVTHPQFAWLRPFSELIVRIDEATDSRNWEVETEADAIFDAARAVVAPSEAGAPNARRYHDALQALPDAILAHREVINVLKSAPPAGGRVH